MSHNELSFDNHNVAICMSEVKDMFRMHFEQGCRYVAKRMYNKILAADFDSFINAGRHQRTDRRKGCCNDYRNSLYDNGLALICRGQRNYFY
ncbi:MAG: hypothetical protein U9R56_04245 [candidate division Zixibacteria bacterium]|nr:hypothetical protein [candidate division Zixibacteria bacterium]